MSRIAIEPVKREPVEEKTFDAMWLTSVVTITPTPFDVGKVVITWKPMASDGELLDDERRIECESLMVAVQEVPALQQAFGAILASVVPLQDWIAKQAEEREQEEQSEPK
jgi:hypothetical protein